MSDLSLTIRQGRSLAFWDTTEQEVDHDQKLSEYFATDEWEIYFDGQSLVEHREAIKTNCLCAGHARFVFTANGREYWDLIAAAYEVPAAEKAERLQKLGRLFDMLSHEEETIASFSHGMRQKTLLIGALIPDPDIWILDEPLQGLDPQAAYDLKEMMKQHAAKGKTVIFHPRLGHRPAVVRSIGDFEKGELLYNGSVADLLAQHPSLSLETIYLQMTGRSQEEAILAEAEEA